MTVSEFKAWLEGFSVGMKDCPTKEDWLLIKSKIARLEDRDTNRFNIPNYNLPSVTWK
jgi:hypothetical protein